MNSKWVDKIQAELSNEYDIPCSTEKSLIEVFLPANRHTLDIVELPKDNFLISLNIADDSFGLLVETDLYSDVKIENLSELIAGVYHSYE